MPAWRIMGSQHRRRLIAAGGIVAIGAISAIVVVLAGSASSDNPGLGQSGAYANRAIEVPSWIHREHLPPAAVPGANVFATAGCTTCHTYAGSGTSALHAPDLTAIGSRHLGIAFEMRKLECPECVTPGSPMPRFASLGPRRLRQLAVFLEASKCLR
jgi:cytochrome c553